MPPQTLEVTGGVDTHADNHVAAVMNNIGAVIGTKSFPVSEDGYRSLTCWMCSFGDLKRVGVEGTGSYGAGLARHLSLAGVDVIEVNRPNRQLRRRRGKSDTTDAESAARSVLNGDARTIPKSSDGTVEGLRALRVARRSAMKARTQAANQLQALIVTAPSDLRAQLCNLAPDQRVKKCAGLRPATSTSVQAATKLAIRCVAQRHVDLTTEIETLDDAIMKYCAHTNAALLGACGVGVDVASALLVAAGDNPQRMRSEASFAAMCGSSPVEASSGKTTRHRLNRGGNREANNALWRIAMVRLSCDPKTIEYSKRRRSEGKSGRETIRCLKRYIAREIFHLLIDKPSVPTGADLRQQRTTARLTLNVAAQAVGTFGTRISELERGLRYDTALATRYQEWLTTKQTS